MKKGIFKLNLVLPLLLLFFNGSVFGSSFINNRVKIKSFVNQHNTYYVDSESGDDNNDGSMSKPWKTLNKVNGFTFQPGDSVLFKRGKTFTGKLNIHISGTSDNYITYGAYGVGAKPIISGFETLSQWKNVGGKKWEATCVSCQGPVNMVLLNNEVKGVGRYPKATAANKGYFTFSDHSAQNTIYDKNLDGSTDWTGAELVVRRTQWVLDHGIILSSSGGNITYKANSRFGLTNGFGYFIQNDPRFLTQAGDWYYNVANKKLQMYFAASQPDNATVKVANTDDLVTINKTNFILLKGIAFQGSNTSTLKINYADHVIVSNCDISFSGKNAINANPDATNLVVENSSINFTNNTAIAGYRCDNAVIKNNTITNTGTIAGMGSVYSAIDMNGDNTTIALNKITNTGYNGISLYGNNCEVKNNVIDNFNTVVDDGGGIYLGGSKYTGRKIIGNFITNGIAAPNGTAWPNERSSEGIYSDDSTSNVSILSNTIANVAGNGIKVHNAHKITILNNTLYNNGVSINLNRDKNPAGGPIRDLVIKNNMIFSKSSNGTDISFTDLNDDVSKYGQIDSNYYAKSNAGAFVKRNAVNALYSATDAVKKNVNSALSGFDRNSKTVSVDAGADINSNNVRFECNTTAGYKTISLGSGVYSDLKNNSYTGTVKIAPFTSLILLKKQ